MDEAKLAQKGKRQLHIYLVSRSSRSRNCKVDQLSKGGSIKMIHDMPEVRELGQMIS